EGGGVAVEVTWVTSDYLSSWGSAKAKEYGIEKYVLLLVKLDTHSGELGRYDLVEVASLRLEGGEYRPAAWEAIDDTSHHREGILVFPRQAPDGTRLDAGPVEVVMKGIAGVPERIFRWELAPDVSGG
ncbi:MAG: hypothetical protein Q8P22_02245, partial [Chloroflexota bacterium]|nr:hypothetical protein [Chloroflexota bacterium]